ncbi:hypothetical protein Ait01nite_087980 [Actinoplanes italicus]|nr:hypothetical protein Ait01nite_087980 [Actinoplanes italicus]
MANKFPQQTYLRHPLVGDAQPAPWGPSPASSTWVGSSWSIRICRERCAGLPCVHAWDGRTRPSLEEFTRDTPLTVGSPQQVIDRTLGFRYYAGDY